VISCLVRFLWRLAGVDLCEPPGEAPPLDARARAACSEVDSASGVGDAGTGVTAGPVT
jgi:hypothetical protein